ncbi:MAG TPA: hypothetical protein VNA04_07665 [Thermoanaerobaculia bacterium]|nr:hypothetical protein [Thermoanaerobaculia bacterium]
MAVAVLALLVSCASTTSDSGLGNARVKVVKPEIEIAQISSVPPAARHVQGGVPVQYAVRVGNRSRGTITLKSVTVVSMGVGAYDVESTSRPFSAKIEPDQYEVVQFWVPAYVNLSTVMGANGPVTLRAVFRFDSPDGQFQEVIVRQVNAMPGRERQ